MDRVDLPLLWNQEDIKRLNYPNDIEVGMVVWDHCMKQCILITDQSSVNIHKSCYSPNGSSRTGFATHSDIRDQHERIKNGCKTHLESQAYNKMRVIYYL